MSMISCFGFGLSQAQVETFKLGMSRVCSEMTAQQILDIADHLHEIIRMRSSSVGSLNLAIYDGAAQTAEQASAS